MLTQLKRVDFMRLAGISSVLGLDLDGASARIVPVTRRGNPLDKYKATFFADAPVRCNFPEGATPQEKGRVIREALREGKIKTRHCVATFRSPGVRTVAVQLPAPVHDYGEWISEHAAKLLKVPIPLSELELRWSVLEDSPGGPLLEVTFVRKSDLAELREVLKAARLTVLQLSAGVGDVVNALFVSEPSLAERDITVAYAEGEKVTLLPLSRGKRKSMVSYPNGLSEQARRMLGEHGELLWAGARRFPEIYPQDKELKPYNLTADYCLATGVALKGFLSELNPVDFLSETEREQRVAGLWQVGFRRTAIFLGSLLLALLAVHAAASLALGRMSDQLDEEASSSQDVLTEVRDLREKVEALEAQVHGARSKGSQGNFSRVLHRLAGAVPEAVRLDRLQAQAEQQNSLHLALSLSAKSRDGVTTFMKELQQRGFSEVTLIRLSAGAGTGNGSSLVGAELELTAKPEVLP